MIDTPRDLLYWTLFATLIPALGAVVLAGKLWPVLAWIAVFLVTICTERKGKK